MNIACQHNLRLRLFQWLVWVCLLHAGFALANGTVTHLSGVVQTQKEDGSLSNTKAGSKLRESETLVTGVNGYARLEMVDGAEMVLRPQSKFRIESYRYAAAEPSNDQSFYRLLQGGLRAISGFISKRGNKDAYKILTPTATIGIRGTQFDVRYCDNNCGALAAGTYVVVRYGAIVTKNDFGELQVQAGKAAFTPPNAAPVPLPRDPGIGFTPPLSIPKLDEKKKLETQTAKDVADGSGAGKSDVSPQGSENQGTSGATSTTGTTSGNDSTQTSFSSSTLDASTLESGKPIDSSGLMSTGLSSNGASSAAQCVVE
jgi:hypothetical protein